LIFVTVGTHHQPFDRLLSALGPLDEAELVVQYGPAAPPSGVARAEAYMPFDAMLECLREADVVVTHAGVGSILCARREGHVPLVVPRRHDLGEHVDEHQAELTRALEARGSVVAVWDTGALAEAVASAPPRRPQAEAVEPPLCPSVRAALMGTTAQASEA
jgi:UDP-N-acetylglucosamine--N-acetylmuramyl-(pentapeptide) pyrophosphoryl-undecaprenol N-acetylglucosamine transferase